MSQGHTYKVVEVTGSSSAGVTEAMQSGVARAGKTLRNLEWIEVTSIRGHVVENEIQHFQVAMKIGFRLEEPGT